MRGSRGSVASPGVFLTVPVLREGRVLTLHAEARDLDGFPETLAPGGALPTRVPCPALPSSASLPSVPLQGGVHPVSPAGAGPGAPDEAPPAEAEAEAGTLQDPMDVLGSLHR